MNIDYIISNNINESNLNNSNIYSYILYIYDEIFEKILINNMCMLFYLFGFILKKLYDKLNKGYLLLTKD